MFESTTKILNQAYNIHVGVGLHSSPGTKLVNFISNFPERIVPRHVYVHVAYAFCCSVYFS